MIIERGIKPYKNKVEKQKSEHLMSRRKFLKNAGQVALAAGVLGSNTLLPEYSRAGELDKNEQLEDIVEVINILNFVEEAFLSGKRINLVSLRKALNNFLVKNGVKYSGNYAKQLDEMLKNEGFAMGQVAEVLNDRVEYILGEADKNKNSVQELVYNLEDLKEGRIRSPEAIIRMAQLYALSSKRGGNNEYGLNYVINEKEPNKATITESLRGREEGVALDISNELKYGPDYEIVSLHTHPDEFSFFSVVGDLTYYLSEIDNINDLKQFTAKMVDKSGIVWTMRFNEMSEEELYSVKTQFIAYQTFFIKHGLILQNIYRENISSLTQFLLEADFLEGTQEVIDKLLDVAQKDSTINRDLIQGLKKLRNDLEKLEKEIPDLMSLHRAGLKVLGAQEKERFVSGVLFVQKEFKRVGIKVYPEVPGRVKKKWNE